jgi:hypothetical protein
MPQQRQRKGLVGASAVGGTSAKKKEDHPGFCMSVPVDRMTFLGGWWRGARMAAQQKTVPATLDTPPTGILPKPIRLTCSLN